LKNKNIYKYINNTIIVMPAYNEEITINSLIKSAQKYGTVIVVNDGSTDDTYRKAKETGAIVLDVRHGGYDKALIKGIIKAKEIYLLDKNLEESVLVTMDSDGQHDPNNIKHFVSPIFNENIDMVLGYRNVFPRFSEIIMNNFFKKIFTVSDILCGMKSYKLSLINNKNINNIQSSVGTGLALYFLHNKFNWTYHCIGIENRIDARSRIGTIAGNFIILKALIKTFIKLLLKKGM